MKIFLISSFSLVVQSISLQKECFFFVCFLASNLSLRRSHVGSLFTSEEQGSLARDVIDTVPTCSSIIHDVTDVHIVGYKSAGHVFATSRVSILHKQGQKSIAKIAECVFFFRYSCR